MLFCNHDGLQKHFRSITSPASEIPDVHLPIQPRTSYGGDAGFQAVQKMIPGLAASVQQFGDKNGVIDFGHRQHDEL